MTELEPYDIEILKYANKFEISNKNDILRKFPKEKYSTEYRLKKLLAKEYYPVLNPHIPAMSKVNSSYLEERYNTFKNDDGTSFDKASGTYRVTDLGKSFLQTHKIKSSEKRKQFILKVLPIGISTIALLKSFDKELISIWKLIMQ